MCTMLWSRTPIISSYAIASSHVLKVPNGLSGSASEHEAIVFL